MVIIKAQAIKVLRQAELTGEFPFGIRLDDKERTDDELLIDYLHLTDMPWVADAFEKGAEAVVIDLFPKWGSLKKGDKK
jgi:hypothetical protein